MIKRVSKVLFREFGGLHQAALILALSSIISALLGLLRDRLLAGTFGAGETLDIYYAAFKIPDFLYILSLAIVSVTVLIPSILEKISFSEKDARDFINNIFSIFLMAMVLLIIIAFFLIPSLSNIIAPGFPVEAKDKLINLSRVLLLSPLLLGLSNLFSSIVQSYRKFFVYALSPVLYNLGIIFGIIFLSPKWGILGIVMGVVLGALLHFLIQIPTVIKLGFIPKVKLRMNFHQAYDVAKLSLPRTAGLGLNEIMMIFITATASILGAGSIAVFNLSFNLQSIPLAVIGVSYSVATFPILIQYFVNKDKKNFLEYTSIAMRQIIFWSIPASVLLIVLRAQLVRVILGYGEFGWRGTRLVAASLALFGISITAQALIILFVRAFYAAGRTLKPIIINILFYIFIVLGIIIFLKIFSLFAPIKYFFETILRVKDVEGTEMLVLPFIFSIGMILNALFLVRIFQKEFGPLWNSVKKTFSQVILASLLMGTITYFSLNILDKIFDIRTFVGIFFQGLVSAIAGMSVWFIALRSVENKELKEIVESLRQRFWDTPTVAPAPEELP